MLTRLPQPAPVALALLLTHSALGAGTLTPLGAPQAPIQILDHHVDVVINNGFARTEVTQTFFNPNAEDLEAIYSFPVPRSASLSEVSISIGEREIHGEVLPREQARQTFAQERSQGNDAGLAEKNSFYTYDFHVWPVRGNDQTRIRFLYYQPVEVDTGVGRYLYPLEEGGTDEMALQFWTTNAVVEGTFSARLELKSGWPVAEVRTPGIETEATVQALDQGHYVVTLASASRPSAAPRRFARPSRSRAPAWTRPSRCSSTRRPRSAAAPMGAGAAAPGAGAVGGSPSTPSPAWALGFGGLSLAAARRRRRPAEP